MRVRSIPSAIHRQEEGLKCLLAGRRLTCGSQSPDKDVPEGWVIEVTQDAVISLIFRKALLSTGPSPSRCILPTAHSMLAACGPERLPEAKWSLGSGPKGGYPVLERLRS